MFKSSILPVTFSWILILITVSGSHNSKYLESINLYSASDKILIAAHRGIHANYPENSLPAIEECIKKGIDIVELDIRETRDKIPVVIHDPNIIRTTNSNYQVSELRFEDLKKYPLLFNGKQTVHSIPSLEQVLKITRNKIILNLDFKLNELDAFERTYELIAKYGMERSVLITLHKLSLLPELYKLNPEIRIMPVAYSWWKIDTALNNEFLDIIQLHHRPYSNYNINRIEKNNIDIWVNSLRKYDRMEKTGGKGFEKLIQIKRVDVIQTDYPEELISFLQEKGLHK